MTKLVCLFLFLGIVHVSGTVHAQNERVFLENRVMTLEQVFHVITEQLQYEFFYSNDELDLRKEVTLSNASMRVDRLLESVLESGMSFKFIGKTIVITPTPAIQTVRMDTITGTVVQGGNPLPGVTVRLKGTTQGTTTDIQGRFRLFVPATERPVLVFSFIGMSTQEVVVSGREPLRISMEEDVSEIDEVVVMGMFTRKAESFTGAAVTFKQEDLKRVGNQNIISSLKNLDPSFIVAENLEFGSDPNRLPTITMRGQTSIPDLKGDYAGNPNQPLFILDGFETSLERVYDMDMNMVSSVTLLKDAAAKAIYGSKAANGVVVIETVLPKSGKLQFSYSGSMNVEAPDLTSYNLTNAAEKLQAEWLAGKYTRDGDPNTQARLWEQYQDLLKEVARGVDTYWLSQPLRTGIGQNHSLSFSGGDSEMRYSASVSYSNVKGVMKDSERQTLSGNLTLSYRYKDLNFRNNLTVSVNKGKNSPYGSFTEYANMNPYWRVENEHGRLIKQYDTFRYNPLYNANLGVKDESNYTTITENFYIDWAVLENLRVTGRLGVTKSHNDSERFLPGEHTNFASVDPRSESYPDRGSYSMSNGKELRTNIDFGLNYSVQKEKHFINANLLWNMETSNNRSVSISVLGFPSDKMDYITLGNRYSGLKPGGSEATTRSISIVGSANYSFDNRYLADFSYRTTASSQFGADNRWGHFWSAGIGWNIHHEAFMQSLTFVDMFKIRGSLGYTGSQNFNPYQAIASYEYSTEQSYDGELGNKLLGLANPNLKWQQQYDRNIGVELSLFNRVSLKGDYYSNITTDLLSDITVAPSMGFATYKENLGQTENTGYQLGVQWRAYSDSKRRQSVNVFANVAHNKNRLTKISDALKKINEEQDGDIRRRPVVRFNEGESLTGIWGVPSLGIDPATGREVFVKKNGTLTNFWSAEDQIVLGDSEAKITGNVGANVEYKGFSLNLSFNFRAGGQTYNNTLVDKVEKVDIASNNVDKRVLYDRWKQPGDEAKYKAISDYTETYPTSRFVEDLDEFVFSSVNLGYDFSHMAFIKQLSVSRLRASFNMNDVGRLSTVKQERGTSYPFARTFSFSLQASF